MASFIANLDQLQATANGAALTSGVMTSAALQLGAGQRVTSISFASATTAAGTPTHWGFAIYSAIAVPALLGRTADQLTAAWAANTVETKALTTPFTIPKTGIYWVSIWVAATTVPTLLSAPIFAAGLLNATGITATQKPLAVTSGSGLTTAPPATIVTGGTASLTVPWCAVS
jgi:hypothetical protein